VAIILVYSILTFPILGISILFGRMDSFLDLSGRLVMPFLTPLIFLEFYIKNKSGYTEMIIDMERKKRKRAAHLKRMEDEFEKMWGKHEK
jgi:hypothetical protein